MEKLQKEYIVEETLCLDCQRWEEDQKWKGVLDKNISLYEYDDFLKDIIARFKFRGDYILCRIFARKINEILKTLDYGAIVPIPLSNERLMERGFNQATALANEAGLQVMDILQRTHTEKQSKKSRQERIQLQQIFTVKKLPAIMNQSIILIDDIYTTGSTLRHAAKELKEAGANSVTALTVARG
jgi:competence protein ComFC